MDPERDIIRSLTQSPQLHGDASHPVHIGLRDLALGMAGAASLRRPERWAPERVQALPAEMTLASVLEKAAVMLLEMQASMEEEPALRVLVLASAVLEGPGPGLELPALAALEQAQEPVLASAEVQLRE